MKVITIKPQLNKLIQESIRELLVEGQESKNISRARTYAKNQGYSETNAQRIIDEIRGADFIPNSREFKCRYLLGVTRLYLDGQISEKNERNVLNAIIPYLKDSYELSHDLDGMNIDQLIRKFSPIIEQDKLDKRARISQEEFENDGRYNGYEIVPIEDWNQASEFSDYVRWCVVTSPDSYSKHTDSETGIFYFLLKDGFEDMEEPSEKGPEESLDEYGLSMVAVSVNIHGDLKSCTGRYNDGDNIMDEYEISELIGADFHSVFKPRNKEDIVKNMTFGSDGLSIQGSSDEYDSGNDQVGLMDKNLEWVLEPYYGEIREPGFDGARVILAHDEGYGLFDKDSWWVLEPQYYDIHDIESDGTRRVEENDRMGLYHKGLGKWILEIEYDDISELKSDGTRIVKANNKRGILNKKFKLTMRDVSYEEILDVDRDGRRRVKDNGKWGLMNKNFSKWLLNPQYGGISDLQNDGCRGVGYINKEEGNKVGLVDKNLNLVLDIKYQFISPPDSDGTRRFKLNKKYGLFDRNLNVVVEPKYDDIGLLSDGAREVMLNKKFGLLDENFNLVLDIKYDYITRPNNGVFGIRLNSEYGEFNINTKQISWRNETVSESVVNRALVENVVRRVLEKYPHILNIIE